ncbi:RidA family protein [Alsobacter sp. R-9]
MTFVPEYPALDDTPRSHLPFSPCVKVGPFVFVSGQASVDRSGAIVNDSFEAEVRRSIENMREVLKAAGCDLADVVQTRNYVRDAADVPEFNRLYREYFRAPFPARTTITGCLSGLKYEIECIAVARA